MYSILFDLVRLISVRFGSVRFGSVRFGSVRFGSVRFGSVRFGSGRVGSVRVGSVRFGSVQLVLSFFVLARRKVCKIELNGSDNRAASGVFLPPVPCLVLL